MGLQDRKWFQGGKDENAPEAPASPDILGAPPKRAEGVKLVNKKPLIIGGAAVGLVGLVMVYTVNERQERKTRPAAETAEATSERAGRQPANQLTTPDFLSNAPEGGVVPPESGYGTLPALHEGPEAQLMQAGGPPPPQLVHQNAVGPAAANPYQTAWERYYQQRQQVAQQRHEQAANAVGASSAVEIRDQRGATGQNGAGGGAYAGAAPGGGYGAAQLPAPRGNAAGGGMPDLNRQDDKRAFLENSGGRNPYAAGRVQNAVSPNEIKAGAVIPAVLTGGVNSDLPGQITAQVTRNVFDTATGRRLLIPQGARLVGVYDSTVTTGQSRVLVAWNRIIYPDGSSIDIGSMPAADAAGYAGVRDRVNNHYAQTFGSAIFLSIFAAGAQLSQPQATVGQNESASQIMAAQLGQQVGQLGMETARRRLQVQPSLTLRPGLVLNVQVTQDLILREWQPRRS